MIHEYLLLDDICPILHIGKSTAYKLIQSGVLPAKKIGRKWLITQTDLEKYISTAKTFSK